ncbi:DNA/RNA nuclease SfsA [Kangiella sediminilitoris]|uniref:Sugar fermentation stimulation protein homolog n=1 Tax=Kangiella sediminilitoris TaxID=1144748 RepID=A0A1B3BD65_9GAMM|nr:DNA/RNA nuclease SfsA [Kangiella sediminilitoris]AOE50756.1 XRE family transcriptional regulator [Kangiella sediminilitoris]
MKFSPPLIKATLLKRYKRFLADVVSDEHGEFTAHCPNTGSMKNCWQEGDTAWLLDSQNPKRKYRYTWVLNHNLKGDWICINTHLANQIVTEGIENGVLKELQDYESLQQEVKYGDENSRIDLLLTDPEKPDCYVEIKTVTLLETGEEFSDGAGFFPDAVSARGQKHLRELIAMVEQGQRAVLLFLVQHSGIQTVSPAAHIDPKYAELLNSAAQKGVEIYAYNTHISAAEITLQQDLPVIF